MNPAVKHWLPFVVFALALAAAAPRLLPLDPPRFVLAAPLAPKDVPEAVSPARPAGSTLGVPTFQKIPFETRLLANPQASAHAATLAELADGRIAAAWFAGSAEGARDVAIHFSTFDGRQWNAPVAIMTRPQVQGDTARLVRKLGNPVLGVDAQGTLHLWFVAVGYGGWAGSSINHATSGDGGRTWSAAARLITSPFINISTLVRTAPLRLDDGGWGLPAYHEFAAKRSEWLRLDARGQVRDKLRLPGANQTLQPAVVAQDATHALALMRDAGPANRVHSAVTADAGLSWRTAAATPLPNPNAAVSLLRLADGQLLLAFNPQTANRDKLALSASTDGGTNWSAPRLVEDSVAGEFSYPVLLQGRDGHVHLAYTWQRKTIKHLLIAPDSLESSK